MNYVCRGVAIPAEYRAAETTTTADSGAVIPTTIMNEIIQKLESYGSIYAKVRKINVQGGVSIPIADLKPTAHWITEAKSSDDQKASKKFRNFQLLRFGVQNFPEHFSKCSNIENVY